jgi:hypothetical protein
MRRELLNAYLFNSLSEVRWLTEEWRLDCNTERPHKLLGYLSISWWIFLHAVIVSVTIALLALSFQAIKTAMANREKSF